MPDDGVQVRLEAISKRAAEDAAIAMFVSQTPQAQGLAPNLLWHDDPAAQALFRSLAKTAIDASGLVERLSTALDFLRALPSEVAAVHDSVVSSDEFADKSMHAVIDECEKRLHLAIALFAAGEE